MGGTCPLRVGQACGAGGHPPPSRPPRNALGPRQSVSSSGFRELGVFTVTSRRAAAAGIESDAGTVEAPRGVRAEPGGPPASPFAVVCPPPQPRSPRGARGARMPGPECPRPRRFVPFARATRGGPGSPPQGQVAGGLLQVPAPPLAGRGRVQQSRHSSGLGLLCSRRSRPRHSRRL